MLTGVPRRWRGWLDGRLPNGALFVSPLELVTDQPRAALKNADVVFLCARHREIEDLLRRISPHLRAGMLVGAIPGFGGFGLLARRILPEGTCLFGTQRIPFVISRHIPGRSVTISGIRRQTFIGTIPANRSSEVSELLHELFGVPTVPVSHFVNIELSPSNSLVNPARLYSLFGSRYRRSLRTQEEFFLDWDIGASRILLRLDRELQCGRLMIPRDTSFIAPILFQYDSNDCRSLTARIRGLRSLAGRPIPLRRQRHCLILDPQSDYVREDIDFGLALIRDTLRLAGSSTYMMDQVLEWRHRCIPASRTWLRVGNHLPTRSFKSIEEMMSTLD